MATFEVNGKEYELKLNYEAVKRLSSYCEGGAYALIGKTVQGDFELYPVVVHAALFHTGENISLKTVEQEIENLFNEGKLDLDVVAKTLDEVVTQSFFFAKTTRRILKEEPGALAVLENLRNSSED